MNALLKTRIVRMGNSQGIRIPKLLIEQLGLSNEIQMEVRDDSLVIRPANRPRKGWNEKFLAMAGQDDDLSSKDEPLLLTEWDDSEWQW